jgi:DNA-binding MarR family transcriptional regulator
MYEKCLLLARADRATRSLIGQQLERYHLTMMEWLLLGVVCKGPPEGLSMSAVAQALDVTLPQVTALANKLMALKMIKQKTQTNDRRSRHVRATGKGQNVLDDVEETLDATFNEWLSDIPSDQLKSYMDTVTWLATHRYASQSSTDPSTAETAQTS